jgi:exopolysaccharide biosynthesis predicted pyruvyltransferase EpsI
VSRYNNCSSNFESKCFETEENEINISFIGGGNQGKDYLKRVAKLDRKKTRRGR